MQGDINGKDVLVGSRGFLAQRGVDAQRWEARAEAWRAQAKTVVFFAVNGIAAVIAAVADPIKESTPEAIAALKRTGLRIVMLTGASRSTAEAVARQLGIEEALAEVLPEDKAGTRDDLPLCMAGMGKRIPAALSRALCAVHAPSGSRCGGRARAWRHSG